MSSKAGRMRAGLAVSLGLTASLIVLLRVGIVGGIDSPGTPVYSQHINDCVTGDNNPLLETVDDPNDPDPTKTITLIQPEGGCDDYQTDYYERPFDNSNQDDFFPDLDIVTASFGADSTWFYCRIDLFGLRDGTKLDAMYACEQRSDRKSVV